jgi:hypothetical protein
MTREDGNFVVNLSPKVCLLLRSSAIEWSREENGDQCLLAAEQDEKMDWYRDTVGHRT